MRGEVLVLYQSERLGHHEGVVVDGEFRVTQRMSQVHAAEAQHRTVDSITATGFPAESATACRKPGRGTGSFSFS